MHGRVCKCGVWCRMNCVSEFCRCMQIPTMRTSRISWRGQRHSGPKASTPSRRPSGCAHRPTPPLWLYRTVARPVPTISLRHAQAERAINPYLRCGEAAVRSFAGPAAAAHGAARVLGTHAQGPLGSQRGCHQRRAVGAQLGAAAGAVAGGGPLKILPGHGGLEHGSTKHARRHAH